MTSLTYSPLRYHNRWFAYIDLLGFTNLVHSESMEDVLPVYSEAIGRMSEACELGKKKVGLISSWFSDTFIIYSRSDSLQEFAYLENAARIFFELLLIKRIPARGCISHGKLYSQARKNIFVGSALIEAHHFGEALDWIGFCLAPSVETKLKCDLPLEQRPFYKKISNREILRKADADYLYAFAFNNGKVNGSNPFRTALLKMKKNAPPEVVRKYDNTLEFLDTFNR
ncbi:hypothetical protein [Roseibium sp. MMSF_3544]|uniref:hypothetical protein n=1 Tax=unclassified Roseibium TaxID=2629323 RepID=UPI00273EF828|nr:hypothetical protein [Roseibium sp. MMSF_3544]